MNDAQLFAFLAHQDATTLLDLLREAYAAMSTPQRRAVFGESARAAHQSCSVAIDGHRLLENIKKFHQDSFDGIYYAPFNVNSKNFMHIPEETEEWFETLGEFLAESATLTAQGAHAQAVTCFGLLYALIDAMESGEDIVFADELGSWMIPGDEPHYIAAYFTSLAAVATPEEFTTVAVPLMARDSSQSFPTRAYAAAMRVANKGQSAALQAERKCRKIRTSRRA